MTKQILQRTFQPTWLIDSWSTPRRVAQTCWDLAHTAVISKISVLYWFARYFSSANLCASTWCPVFNTTPGPTDWASCLSRQWLSVDQCPSGRVAAPSYYDGLHTRMAAVVLGMSCAIVLRLMVLSNVKVHFFVGIVSFSLEAAEVGALFLFIRRPIHKPPYHRDQKTT